MSKDKPNEKLKFKRDKSHSFTIVDGSKKEVGTIRIKPGAIGWKAAHDTQWLELSMYDFHKLIKENGAKGDPA